MPISERRRRALILLVVPVLFAVAMTVSIVRGHATQSAMFGAATVVTAGAVAMLARSPDRNARPDSDDPAGTRPE